jgi:hypothetical protein
MDVVHNLDVPHRALTTIDILVCVLEVLRRDRKTLCIAMRVNRIWASAASSILWKVVPVILLFRVNDARRRQFYADFIRVLWVWPNVVNAPGNLELVEFPRLRAISLESPTPVSRFQRYLLPSLVELAYTGLVPATLGPLLAERCPGVREVRFSVAARRGDVDGAKAELSALRAFFTGCSLPLTTVCLDGHVPDCAESRALMEHLAHRPGLADLDTSSAWCVEGGTPLFLYPMEAAAPRRSHDGNPRLAKSISGSAFPYHDLRRLEVCGAGRHIECISLGAPFLAILDVSITDSGCVFAALGALSGLNELNVHFGAGTKLADSDMCALQQLPNLRALSISGNEKSLTTALTDEGFSEMANCLPKLRRLRFAAGLSLRLSGAALRSVGEHCRHLESLIMPGIWDISCWPATTQKPLFPRLTRLKLDEAIMKAAGGTYDR